VYEKKRKCGDTDMKKEEVTTQKKLARQLKELKFALIMNKI